MNFVIYIFYINLTFIYSYIEGLGGNWEAIKLENGNFLIFSGNGLYTLDPTFQILNYTDEVKIINNFYTTIKQFTKEDGSYILIKSFKNDYILNSEGNLLYIINDNINMNIWSYSVIPYNHSRDVFNYYIIYFKDNQMILNKNSYYSKSETLESQYFNFNNTYELYYDSITCQLMTYSNENVISCFFLTKIDNEYFINCTVFKAEENFEIIKTSELKTEMVYSGFIKSEVMSNDDRQKVVIVFLINGGGLLCYIGYDINTNNFTIRYLSIDANILPFIFIYYIDISYFKETEEFIFSLLYTNINLKNTTYYNVYFIYSIDKNFEYSFFGLLGDFNLRDSFCQNKPFIMYFQFEYFLHKIFFSSAAQKYCIILNLYLNSSEIISFFIINKEIKIINPTELKSSDSPPKFICENYTNDYLNLSENNFLEKCTSEIDYMISNFTCFNYTYKTFEFSFNCSKKYPYEIVETQKCVEFCDENSLSNGKCIMNYNNSNNINIRENVTDINSYEAINNPSDSISTEIKYIDIKTYSSDSIIEEKIMEFDNSTSSYINLITKSTNFVTDSQTINIKIYSTDSITEEKIMEFDNSISPDTNLITKSTNFITDSQTINQLNITNKVEAEEKIYDLLNKIINEKTDNDKNFIENIQNIFSDNSFNNILDNIVNEEKDITISNNETIIQITSTVNQRNNKIHNISTIDLGVCEKTLKKIYKIDENKALLILKIDSFIEGSKIPVIRYEVYHPDNKSKLNLSFCNNNIEIKIPILIDENNLYKHEPDSDYYNDRCFLNTLEKGKDTPLECRRKEFVNNNMYLCEPECNYLGYDFDIKNSKCECEIKRVMSIFNIKIDTQRLYNKFTGLTSSNIDIIKCYYLLLKKENLIYNIGFYIILFIIFLFCIGALTFILKGYSLLVQKINIIISIIKKTNKIMVTTSLIKKITKNTIKRNKNMIKRKRKKNRKSNPPIKKK